MYKCESCNSVFEEPKQVKTTYESVNGVSGLFPNNTSYTYETCPYCESESFNEVNVQEAINSIEGFCEDNIDYLTYISEVIATAGSHHVSDALFKALIECEHALRVLKKEI